MSSDGFSRVLRGWLAACGAATASVWVFGLVLLAIVSGGSLIRFAGGAVALSMTALLFFIITCALTAIPSAAVIWLSERFQIRSVLFFGCGGAVIGALSQTLLLRTFVSFSWLFVLAGCLAGKSYWHVAGKHAGHDCGCASQRSQTAASDTRAVTEPNTSSNAPLSAMSTSTMVTS